MNQSASTVFNSRNAATGLFLVVAISLIFNTVKVIQKNYELQQKVDLLADEVSLIEVQNQNLAYNIEYYKTDAYLKTEAKRRFNLAEPGEKVILLEKDGDVEPDPPFKLPTENQDVKQLHQDNFDKWMIFLFGKSN